MDIIRISTEIKKMRIAAGYKLARTFLKEKSVKISLNTYYSIENGSNKLTIVMLLKILEAHNISLYQFFKNIEDAKI